jgi:hypothetical protein
MSRLLPTGLTLSIACAIGIAAPVVTAAPAHAARCAGTNGVTVIVDLKPFGKGVRTKCASGNPTSGLDALTKAGFTYSFLPRQPGFVCQINALPKPCNGAPTHAYWSYWHGTRGGTWTYSSAGAGSYDPAPGTVEGWAFGAGTPPTVRP